MNDSHGLKAGQPLASVGVWRPDQRAAARKGATHQDQLGSLSPCLYSKKLARSCGICSWCQLLINKLRQEDQCTARKIKTSLGSMPLDTVGCWHCRGGSLRRMPDALAEDPSLVPSTRIRWRPTPGTPVAGTLRPFSGCIGQWYSQTHAHS